MTDMSLALAYARASDHNDSLENPTTKAKAEIVSGEASTRRCASNNRGGSPSNPGCFDYLSEVVSPVCATDGRRDGGRAF
jgi:hypothetical protein